MTIANSLNTVFLLPVMKTKPPYMMFCPLLYVAQLCGMICVLD